MHTFLTNLISFNTWAAYRSAESLQTCPEMPPKGIELLSHFLQTTWYVLDLIEGNDDGRRWYDTPDYTFEESIAEIPKIDAAYKKLIEGKSQEQLDTMVSFIDFSGNRVERTISELIFHTYDHWTYHRGQIAMVVRQSGGEPAFTWYNRWVRDTNRGQI